MKWIKTKDKLPECVEHDVLFAVKNAYGELTIYKGEFFPKHKDDTYGIRYEGHFVDENYNAYLLPWVEYWCLIELPEGESE